MGVIHETGHALYERGLPTEWRLQPVGLARGMSMHESQSLLMEMQACRSAPFNAFLAAAGGARPSAATSPALDADNFQRVYTRVNPDFIRVEADEVTYPAHVILRYRLEKALIAGDMKLADLPAAWNEGMKKLLGIVPPSDREGCLQDIHWYDGAWGYFPTYTLGAMTAAQLFEAACRAQPSIPTAIGRGDFAPLLTWLRTNVHGQGSRLSRPRAAHRRHRPPAGPRGIQGPSGAAISELGAASLNMFMHSHFWKGIEETMFVVREDGDWDFFPNGVLIRTVTGSTLPSASGSLRGCGASTVLHHGYDRLAPCSAFAMAFGGGFLWIGSCCCVLHRGGWLGYWAITSRPLWRGLPRAERRLGFGEAQTQAMRDCRNGASSTLLVIGPLFGLTVACSCCGLAFREGETTFGSSASSGCCSPPVSPGSASSCGASAAPSNETAADPPRQAGCCRRLRGLP